MQYIAFNVQKHIQKNPKQLSTDPIQLVRNSSIKRKKKGEKCDEQKQCVSIAAKEYHGPEKNPKTCCHDLEEIYECILKVRILLESQLD